MEKKKAIKIVTATAIAASAFTAVAPAQSEAASSLDKQISKAKSTMKKPYSTYAYATKLASVSTVSKEIAAAKKAESSAIKAINKAKLSASVKKKKIADVKKYEVYITRAQGYVNAYNAAAKASAALTKQYAQLKSTVATGDLEVALEQYTELQVAIKEAKKDIINKVYGSKIETLLFNKFTKPTETLLKGGVQKAIDAYKYEETKKAEAAKVNAYVAATKDLTTLEKVEAAKAAKAKINLDQLKVADQSALHDKIVEADKLVAAAEEALKVPAVESVSAINAKQIVVTFNTELSSDDTVVGDASEATLYSLDGVNPATAVLSKDKKSVTLTFAGDVEGDDQVVVVNPVATSQKDADGAVVKTVKYSQVFSYTDKVKPEVTGTSYENGKIIVSFSEEIGTEPAVIRVNGVPVDASNYAVSSTDSTKVEIDYPGLAASTTASLYIAGAKDASASQNEMNFFNGTVITPGADTGKPQVIGVQVTGQNTAKVTLSEAITAATVNATLQKGSTQYPVTLVKDTTDTTGKTYTLTVDLNGVTAGDGIFSTTSTNETFTLFVAAGAMTDTATPGNTNDLFSTSVTFIKDVTAPAFVSSQVSSDNKKLEFKFDENLTVAGNDANIVVKNADGVKITVDAAETALKTGADTTYQVDTKTGDVALDPGTYTVTIPAGFFTDAYGNQSAAVTSTFTVGAPTNTDTTKPTAVVTNVVGSTNTFAVAYSEEVTSTALNLANYKLDGESLPVGTEIYFTGTDKRTVNIVLPSNSINIGNQSTGASAILSVVGVADKAGNVINSTNSSVVVKDNTAATVTNVQVLGTDVYITFNEDVTVPATTDALDAFDVTVNGNVLTAADVTDLVAVSGNAKQVKFSLATAPAATPVVKVKANQTVLTDANGVLAK